MERLQAMLILEILGRPKEHVKEALNNLVIRLSSEKGVKIINKKCHEPMPIKESKELFTSFAEVEAEFESLENYFGILFAYMPSNIEIIKPEKLSMSNSFLSDLGSKLLHRLHDYDAITKNLLVERDIILKKIQETSPETFKELITPKQNLNSKQNQQDNKKTTKKRRK